MVEDRSLEVPAPEVCVSRIFEISGVKFDPELAVDLWPKILQHKWLLSEKLGRDVGLRTAGVDFVDNMEQAVDEYLAYKRKDLLNGLGAQTVGRKIWDTISDSQPPKQLVQRRIILPITQPELAAKHGVVPPKTIIFFGPPGTGKTHFVKAIAGVLSWHYIEIVPSMLMVDGVEKVGANLRAVMEKARNLEEAVIFIDEFEEIAGSRDSASRMDKSITNEMLKQVPLLKSQGNRILLVCATNYISQLDAALLRPGRFDCIIPVGSLNDDERLTILNYYIARINAGDIDRPWLVASTARFTPADIEYFFQQVAQFAFEKELDGQADYKVETATLKQILPQIRPTLTDEIIAAFEKERARFARV